MVEFTQHVGLNKTTSTNQSEIIIDRSNVSPLKWFSLIVDAECYIDINKDATISGLHLLAGEAYESPEKVRVIKITVLRATSTDVTVRGSSWW